MRENEEVSKLREKLRQNRKRNSQKSIESRLYGSPGEESHDEKPEEDAEKNSFKEEDISSEPPEESADEYLSESLIEKDEWSEHTDTVQGPEHENTGGKPAAGKKPVKEKNSRPEKKTGKNKKRKKPRKPKKEKKPKRYTRLTVLKENIMLIPKYILVPAAVIFLLFVALIWYVSTDASDLKEIDINGNEIISEEEIENRLDFAAGDKMYGIDTGTAEGNISLLPIIVDVNVERDWWNGVTVNISEHQVIGYIENEGGYNPVLENARILRGYQVSPVNGPLIYFFEGEEMDDLVENLNDIEPEILAGISEVYFRPSENSLGRIHILMNDGQEIVADYRDFGEKMNHYIGMKEEIPDGTEGVIDIEIGSSFLPYSSDEARQIKRGIYNSPEATGYVNEVNTSLNSVKDTLNQFEEFDGE